MKLKTRELDKLRSKLPPKYDKILIQRLSKHSISAIQKVLIGVYHNSEIIDAAIQLAEEHQNELKSRSEKISLL
jgi:hypothetical protein